MAAAEQVEGARGRYVEGAVMTAVPPHRLKVPLLLGGPHAEELLLHLNELGFAAKVASGQLGVASATKMCRSVMIKGLEAMVIESLVTARRYGVEEAVLASLRETFPGIDWNQQASYFFERVIAHGRRGRKRCARRPSPCARPASNHGAPPGPPSARPGWPTSRTRASSASSGASRPIRAPIGASRPTGSSTISRARRRADPVPTFEKTPGWLDWCARPSTPRFTPPPGAVDAHCHVFGPGAVFPYAPERKYTPCDASKAQLFALRDHLGFARNVVVQATCHGADNRAMVDACRASAGKARGVATVRRDVTDRELADLHDAGVRAVRFNFLKRLVDFTPRDELAEIAARIRALGWHVVVYFEVRDLPLLWDFFTALPTAVVVDHMGRPDVRKPIDGPEFGLFLDLLRRHDNVWTKVSCPERLSVSGPPALAGERNAYRDVVPFARRVVESFPDRVLWGTDWPHPNLKDHMPDDGLLVDFIPHIATTPELQQKLLVTNPMRLYWPDETVKEA